MKEIIAVTGANGMLGNYIVRMLLQRNYAVRALIQPGTSVNTFTGLDLEIVPADVTSTCDVIKALNGVDYVIHAAASLAVWPKRSIQLYQVNLQGTANIVLASLRNNVRRLVHVGSANSFAAGNNKNPATECNAFNGYKYGLDYVDSKYQAQQLVLKSINAGLDCVVVNPTFMFGSYDSGFGSGRLILAVQAGKLKAIPPGGRNFICAKDVATGVVNALECGKTGECYILGNQNLSYQDIFSKIAKLVDVSSPALYIPRIIVKLAANLNELASRLTRIPPMINCSMAQIICEEQYYSAAKAVAHLRLPQSPIEEGIAEAWNWFKNSGITISKK